MTEIYPFKISNISVAIAKVFFPVRKTFVVPMLPEPISLISFLRKTFVKMKPKGIDPNKQEIKTITKTSIAKF